MIKLSGDVINALFETIGGALLFLNSYRAVKAKTIIGVDPAPTMFFWLWGVFNLWYYSHLNQPLSTTAGILPTIANTLFLSLWWYYSRKKLIPRLDTLDLIKAAITEWLSKQSHDRCW